MGKQEMELLASECSPRTIIGHFDMIIGHNYSISCLWANRKWNYAFMNCPLGPSEHALQLLFSSYRHFSLIIGHNNFNRKYNYLLLNCPLDPSEYSLQLLFSSYGHFDGIIAQNNSISCLWANRKSKYLLPSVINHWKGMVMRIHNPQGLKLYSVPIIYLILCSLRQSGFSKVEKQKTGFSLCCTDSSTSIPTQAGPGGIYCLLSLLHPPSSPPPSLSENSFVSH